MRFRHPPDEVHRTVTDWDPFLTDLKLIEDEVLGKNGPTCTCPGWWFPNDIKEIAHRLPHNYQGALSHHTQCAKVKYNELQMKLAFTGRSGRFR